MDKLAGHFHKLLKETDTRFFRYMYAGINWNSRLIGLTGPRGVGKTTLVLQYIKERLNPAETLYVTVEDFYFADNRLVDLANTFVNQGGKYLFIDEIHKYRDWSKEVKLIYDYHPGLKVVFTGSSVLDIRKGASDLSRRVVMYHMQGLSFREYLHLFHQVSVPPCTLEDILGRRVEIPGIRHPLPFFNDYLKRGYYPFALDDELELRLQQIINQNLETDIPMYAGMNVSTGRKLKQLLAIIAKSAPFKPNLTKIADMLSVSRNSIADYCQYLEEAGMIAQLRDATGGIRGLGKVDKIYLDNTNLSYNLAEEASNTGNIRETFFFNQMRIKHDVTASPVAGFLANGITFEVGDDVESGHQNVIPLWQFGMTY
ncbi:MAG: AAA family ATPase [Tannerellaceae bacterium]|jgi:predicted AAA+ superfamily ATPase|nr:AAA family ATPase [Tannerellaceae bacterium]